MENSKSSNDNDPKTIHAAEENPNPDIPSAPVVAVEQQQPQGSDLDVVVSNGARQLPSRTPFTNLSQVDADLALARTLQEQERAYMVLRMNGDGSDYGSWETGSYDPEDNEGFDDPSEDEEYGGNDGNEDGGENEDAFDLHAHYEDEDEDEDDADDVVELDPASFPDDESYARALQDAEDRDMAERLLALAGLNNNVVEAMEHHGHNAQEPWDDIDPDELSYEELIALGEIVGTESRGLSVDTITSLPSVKYKTGETQNGSSDSCVICRLDFEEDETLTLLSCKHSYHSECINNWLHINKVCPVCSTEVSTSGPAA